MRTIFWQIMFILIMHSGFFSTLWAQSDDIQISAAFSSSIDLTVTDGANISFVVASLDHYTNGLKDPTAYSSTFEINSSVEYKVDLVATDFADASGNILDVDNFGYYLESIGTNRPGRNLKMLGTATNPSHYALLGNDETIIKSNGQGNVGTADKNRFKVHFELGTSDVRGISSLPALIDQNIAPGTYSSTVTLTASAMP